MSFISKIWNWRPAVTEANYQGHPTFYRITQEIRELIIEHAKLTFVRRDGEPLLRFVALKPESVSQFFATIHSKLTLKQFTIRDNNGASQYCIEWVPEESQLTFESLKFGCSFSNEQEANDFTRIASSIVTEEGSGKACKVRTVKTTPQYMKEEYEPKAAKRQGQLNDILLSEAQDETTKMANTCRLFQIQNKRNVTLLQNAVFVIKQTDPFDYSIIIYNIEGEAYLHKRVTASMSYEVNVDNGQVSWLDLDSSKLYSVLFDKFEVAINVQFAIAECIFELKNKKKLRTSIEEQETKVGASIPMQEEFPVNQSRRKSLRMMEEEPIVNTYVEPLSSSKKSKSKSFAIPSSLQLDDDNKLIFQAKATDRAVICSGQQVNIIKIDENQNIKNLSTNGILGIHGENLTPTKIVMHDSDSKAVIASSEGKLIYTDFVKFKPIQQLNPKRLFHDFCPESKMAELGNYNNLIGVTDHGIYTFDPKKKNGEAHKLKEYKRNNEQFNSISVRQDASFAVGSGNGNIRLFDRNHPEYARSLYPGLGDPVQHMESTKDGKWLLATFHDYIILLPTHTNEDQDLYSTNSFVKQRPAPRKLVIKNQHLKFSKSQDLRLLKAKFDQSSSSSEKYVISGFGEYIVVWSLQNIIAGNLTYTFSKSTGVISDVDFKFNDNKKILTATTRDVHLEHNLQK